MAKVEMILKPMGAVAVVRDTVGKILLLKRAPESTFAPGQWGFPGGKIEKGEGALIAAIRETKEETQLSLCNLCPLGVFNAAVEAFLTEEFTGEVEIDFEHTDWKWLSRADMSTYDLAPSVIEILERVEEIGNN